MTLLIRDELFLQHHTGQHPERPERLQAIDRHLQQQGLLQRCSPLKYSALDPAIASGTHQQPMLDHSRRLAEQGGGYSDPDTVISPRSFEVALHAAGACVAAVDAVLEGKDKNALCLVRPPGHHATADTAMGFCLLNNIALAANHARRHHGLTRILIIDWDVHHGNGTQDIFYDDDQVTFFSIHRYGNGFYPGTGAASESGTGSGLGFTLNVPLSASTTPDRFHEAMRQGLERALTKSQPELILVSAGFDAHRDDPIGGLNLTEEDFATMTAEVVAAAETYCSGRIISCLEGGYDLDALGRSVAEHLSGLLSDKGG